MEKIMKLEVCLGCYASYNDGFLFDKWYTVTDSSELDDAVKEFQAHVMTEIKKAKPEWITEGYVQDTYNEEIYISDSELYIDGDFIGHDFSECLSAATSLLNNLDQTFSHPIGLLMQVASNTGTELEDLNKLDDDLFSFEVDSQSNLDIGYAYAELTGVLQEMPDHLKNYFDYEAYGKDLFATCYDVNGKTYAVID